MSREPSGPWQELVRKALRGAPSYHVPAYPNAIKLDANELPFALSRAALEALGRELVHAEPHRYPDAAAASLRACLATRLGIDPAELMLGNGSDELIALLCATFAEPRPGQAAAKVLYPSPTFVVFRTAALAHGLEPVEVPLGPGFVPGEAALTEAIARERPNLVFLATPNNPTGTVWPPDAIGRLAERFPDVILVVDEAYLVYGDQASEVPRALAQPHVVVLQTLSKIGMAGLRLGQLIGRREVLAQVEKVRPPYNVNTLSQRLALVLLTEHRAELEAHIAEVKRERARLGEAMARLPGLEVFPSGGNFLLVRSKAAKRLHTALIDRGVLVRLFDAGPLAGCLRVTVGTPDENGWLLDALRAVTKA